MAKILLLGNGINSYLGVGSLSASSIKERFLNNYEFYKYIIEEMIHIKLPDALYKYIEDKQTDNGIEQLVDDIYTEVHILKNDTWTYNDQYRIERILKSLSITSIFYDKEGKIDTRHSEYKMFDLKEYENIYTLNYYEFWDDNHVCKYLHGYFDYKNSKDGKNIKLIDKYIDRNDDFNNIKENLNGNLVFERLQDIVFSPTSIEKSNNTNIKPLMPLRHMYPAKDLILTKSKSLYSELNAIDHLDIFGMSPYGDKNIIQEINKCKSVTVYVYGLNNQLTSSLEEVEEWNKVIKVDQSFEDSSEIS